MLRVLLLLMLCFQAPVLSEKQALNEKEALFIRRIVDFWRDGEWQLARMQIFEFFKDYPDSHYFENFQAMLGDIYFSEKNYSKAIEAYSVIKRPDLQKATRFHYADALYRREDYSRLIALLAPVLDQEHPKINFLLFYYAESLLHLSLDPFDKEGLNTAKQAYENLSYDFSQKNIRLAELCRLLQQYREAAYYYEKVWQKDPQDAVLLDLALMQGQFDKMKARANYEILLQKEGPVASKAAKQLLQLLFSQEDFSSISYMRERFELLLQEQEDFHFLMGYSLFAQKRYREAIKDLKKYLGLNLKAERKRAYLSVLASFYALKESTELKKELDHFLAEFPKDVLGAKALFFYALDRKRTGDDAKMQEVLSRIEKDYPDFSEKDALAFEQAALWYRQDKIEQSFDAFENFLQVHQSSSYQQAARHYLVNSSLQLVESLEKKVSQIELTRVFHKAQESLEIEGLFKREELIDYRFKMAQLLLKIKEYSKALEVLKRSIEESEDPKDLYRAHLMMAMCYRESTQQYSQILFHLKQALSLEKGPKVNLHLNLFSVYAEMSKLEKQSAKQYAEKAASHLYLATEDDFSKVSVENHLWLANYYFERIHQHMKKNWKNRLENSGLMSEAERSRRLFEQAIAVRKKQEALFSENNLEMEVELFRLSQLLHWMHEDKKQEMYLLSLYQMQGKEPNWAWNLRARTMFCLAELYEKKGQAEHAKKLYRKITEGKTLVDSALRFQANVRYARLVHASMSPRDTGDLKDINRRLREVSLRKNIATEPIHLEAALDYAHFAAKGSEKKLLEHLQEMKKEFTMTADIVSKDYHEGRQIFQDKDQIYQAYMLYVDAMITKLQASLAKKKGTLHEARVKEEAAQGLLKTLLKDKFAVSFYLVQKAREGLSLQNNGDTR